MFQKLLIPLDRSSLAEEASGQAAAIARASGAAVDVVAVYEPIVVDSSQVEPLNLAEWNETQRYVADIAAELASGADLSVTHATLEGDPIERIAERAAEVGADLIVMTSHGRTGLSRAWLGSVADGLIRHSRVPVLMLRPIKAATPRAAVQRLYKHILVPLDGSPVAEEVLPAAVALAKCSGASLSLLRVVQLAPWAPATVAIPLGYTPPILPDEVLVEMTAAANRQLETLAARLREEGMTVDVNVVVEMSIAPTILEFARTRDVDAIAMSTHGRGLSRLVVGSVADKVLRGSDIALLAYRPSGRGADAGRSR